MRFAELHLLRYGHFEDCNLQFPGEGRDLQIVYGPNEAGKSTTMAAVSDLLFGFPHSTRFDYRFDRSLLRVGATIESSNGTLRCRRKKGTRATLLDDNEQPIDEGTLAALLGGQSGESFQRMFSLDHRRLRDGGQAILDAKDDAGQAIFAAGSGLIGVVALAELLEKEAADIWADRAAASRKYYAALRDYDAAKSRLREHQLKSGQWAERKKALQDAEANLARKRGERTDLQKRLVLVERVRRILSPIAARAHLMEELSAFGDLPTLPPDALQALDTAVRSISEAGTEKRIADAQLETARSEKAQSTFNKSVLGHRQVIAELQVGKGAVDKALRDTPGLEGKVRAGNDDIKRMLADLGWEAMSASEIQNKLPRSGDIATLREFIEEKSGNDAALKAAIAEAELQNEAIAQVDEAVAALPPMIDQAPMDAALRAIRSKGDTDTLTKSTLARRDRSAAAVVTGLKSLAPWIGTADDLLGLPLPSEAQVTHLKAKLDTAGSKLEEERGVGRGKAEEKARKELERDQLLEDQSAVPVAALAGAREKRDATWSQLNAHLHGQQIIPDTSASADQFFDELVEADAVADRRFSSAETSATLAGLERDIARLQFQIEQGEGRIKGALAVEHLALEDWRDATATIVPQMEPLEFIAWRARRDRVIELIEQLQVDEEAVAAANDAAAEVRQLLSTLPLTVDAADISLPLSMVIASAEQLEGLAKGQASKQAELSTRKSTIETAVARAERNLKAANATVEQWAVRWRDALGKVGLSASATIPEVRSQLESFSNLNQVVGDVIGFERRLTDIRHDIESFGDAVNEAARACGIAIAKDEPDTVLRALQLELENAVTLSERTDNLQTQITQAEGRAIGAQTKIETANASIKPLLASAETDDLDALKAIIIKVDDARGKHARVATLTDEILSAGDGRSLEQLVEEAAGMDAAALAAESQRLSEEIGELTSQVEQLTELKRTVELEFHRGDDSHEAAVAAADQALARSEMEVQAEAYLRKRAERELLQWTINRYREEKQAPLLKRATEIFSTLTLGTYVALSVDMEGDKPSLYAIEDGRANIVPASSLSEGTIDQLYLALRLAAVEEAIAAGLKLPFLADDLFINYDDTRASAGFRVLAELAEKTQVLFFTHHPHLIEVARDALHPIAVTSCSLERRPAA